MTSTPARGSSRGTPHAAPEWSRAVGSAAMEAAGSSRPAPSGAPQGGAGAGLGHCQGGRFDHAAAPPMPTSATTEERASDRWCHALAARVEERTSVATVSVCRYSASLIPTDSAATAAAPSCSPSCRLAHLDGAACVDRRLDRVDADAAARRDEQPADASRAHRLELAVAVRVVLVGRSPSAVKCPERDAVAHQVAEGVDGVGLQRRRAGGRADDALERRHAHVRHGAHLGDPVRSLHACLLGRWLRRVVTAGRIAFGRIAASGSTGVAARLASQRDWLP
eukprot:scaffold46869_cov51-Phaeocystis_antarctica.AAC.1